MSSPWDPNTIITDEDIAKLFGDSLTQSPPKTDGWQVDTQPNFTIMDPKEYYWNKRGECPTCKDGSKPDSMPGGYFKCKGCGWVNN